MNRVLLIHWNDEEIVERARSLEEAGFDVHPSSEFGPHDMKGITDLAPDVIVIDLSRLPSHGRDVGLHLRGQKGTRAIPLHFIEGDPEKTARIRDLLPDAGYSDLERAADALRDTIRNAPVDPIVPGIFEPYAGTPLPKKLGIRDGCTITILGTPDDFDSTLGTLPPEVRIRRQARGESDIILLFVRSLAELGKRFPAAEKILKQGGRLWLIWPKKASGVKSDLTQQVVRDFGLGTGLVDFKVSSIDETWSGLCFTQRRKKGS
jgi:hypothetical protein